MYKIVKRNYNKKRGKVLRTYYYRDCVLNFLNFNIKDMQNIIKDKDDFIDIERNNRLITTIYPTDGEIEYWQIKNAIWYVENLKVKESD